MAEEKVIEIAVVGDKLDRDLGMELISGLTKLPGIHLLFVVGKSNVNRP